MDGITTTDIIAAALHKLAAAQPRTSADKAVLAANAMRQIVEIRQAATAAVVKIAVAAWREGYWSDHPSRPTRFRDFIALAFDDPRRSASQISTIASFCENVVTYCDNYGIADVDMLVERWGVTQEAVPALRDALDGGPETVRAAIARVLQCQDRNEARAVFRKNRRTGNGYYCYFHDGDTTIVALVVQSAELDRVLRALAGMGYRSGGVVITRNGRNSFLVIPVTEEVE